ncbi:platelet endothelial cell adhesion molecule isoform X3 [Parambassis ranga]|uniref:Platelet endothelial cell adhesion molecule isoform X3 n=1 Tax=Parambassis ranga TaxID=210632 RepID=A0A6P7I9F6_9TELE|nr:platelet endothelial cell adhesion molecule-like isoform X3 [Parambassis ranga]
MGLLLLLASALLTSHFHTGSQVDAQTAFTIRSVRLTIEPGTDVARGTDVTVRCQAAVSSSGQETLTREYTIYKEGIVVYTKTTSSSEDFLYPLSEARASNSGKYKCKVSIQSRSLESNAEKLTVTGLSDPVLHLKKGVVTEGEDVTVRCTAPGETGSFFFYFYDNSKEIYGVQANTNQTETTLHFATGIHRVHCTYTVFILPDSFKSNKSNTVNVSVKELSIMPFLKVSPQSMIYEGDRLNISCSVRGYLPSSESIELHLSRENDLLSTGYSEISHSMLAPANVPELRFECRLTSGNVVKVVTNNVPVTELFSTPTLTVSPAEVFQREKMMLTCKSQRYATERINESELTYTLDPEERARPTMSRGVFLSTAPPEDINYTCTAEAKGIKKQSQALALRPKVSVSTPFISVLGTAILGQTIQIHCDTAKGSLPINYTLIKGYEPVAWKTVHLFSEKAVFSITINKTEDIKQYMCAAANSHRGELLGERLSANVIEPLTWATLSAVPDLDDLSEGQQLHLICKVKGSMPVTFKWYRVGSAIPLNITTVQQKHKDYHVPVLSKEHNGQYYCEATNPAHIMVRSEELSIEVRLALWKKALIGGMILLVVSLLVLAMCVLHYKSKRGKREGAAELSVKPSSPKSDDTLTVSLTRDTEVYNAATDAAAFYDGKEGRATNGTRNSMASLPADISNRSSYSIPATV